MKKKFILALSVFLISFQGLQAQSFTLSTDSLNFGSVTVGEQDTLWLSIENELGYAQTIVFDTIILKDFFLPFSITSIDGNGSIEIPVIFKPRHNIRYNSELLLVNYTGEAFSIDLRGEARFAGSYYSSTFDLHQEDLKQELKSILNTGAKSLGYNIARDWLYMEIDNKRKNGQGATVNEIETAYIGKQVKGYTSRQDAQSNWNVNTEHTWPQSKFNSTEPMQSDLHALYVVDAGANSRRSNHPFAMVPSPSWQDGGSRYGNQFFEPRDEQKGKAARSMLYFVTRYQNYGNFLLAPVYNGTQTVNQEALMRQWATSFPPTSVEMTRNDKIETLQACRNPYVDHPEFLERIESLSLNSVAPKVRTFRSNGNFVFTPENHHFFGTNLRYFTVGDTVVWDIVFVGTGNVTLNLTLQQDSGTAQMIFPKNITVIPGEATSFQVKSIFSQPGNYLGYLSASGFNMMSHLMSFDHYVYAVGLPEKALSDIEVYPNPADDVLFVQQDGNTPLHLEITNAKGQFVKSTVLNGTLNELKLEELISGIYFVRITRKTSSQVYRIILQ